MARYTGPSKRKISGGLRKKSMGKKQKFLARPPAETHIGEPRKKKVRTLGGNFKIKNLRANRINVLDKNSNKTKNVEIKGLDLNPASRDFTRRKIITKGAIVITELGKVRVTSRPGNDSVINGVLINE
ncbi:MAG: 30S ribosomal protein S8e [Methanobacteriota archaeon]|nr:MAG: 30S ribosomal protein S8e [Euryarchaeota archaeon]